MIPLYVPTRNKFIKDIASPTINDAISKSKKHKKINIPVRHADKSSANLRINNKGKITRVPPMAEMHYYRPVRQTAKIPKKTVMASIPWLPKKYTVSKGVVTDWHAKTFSELKYAAPALIAVYGMMLLALSWQLPEIKDYSSGHPKYVNSTSTGTGNQASPPSTSTTANTGAASANTSSPTSTAIQPITSSLPTTVTNNPVEGTSPIDIVMPTVPSDGGTDQTPPVTVEIPPVTIDTDAIDVQTPSLDLGL